MRAVVGDVTFDDVVAFTASFEPNNFPQATLAVPVGRGFRGTREKAAVIHNSVNDLRIQQKAEVFLRVIKLGSSPGDAEPWPSGEFKIFDGNAVGTGFQRTDRSVSFTIHLLHWLADLHYSSSVSGTSHPANPKHFSFNAAQVNPDVVLGGATGRPLWSSRSGGRSIISSGNIESDLWGSVLQPWLRAIASADRINIDQIPQGKQNDTALNALERIAPANTAGCHVPSALESQGIDGRALSDSLKTALLTETFDSFANTTLWSKLVGVWVPAFFLGVVPRVDDALVIPFTPGLQTPLTTLTASEYSGAQLKSAMPRVPRSVGIFHSVMTRGGFNLTDGGTVPAKDLAGYFEPSGNPDGLVLLKDAPGWLSFPTLGHNYSKSTTGAEKKGAIGSALTPQEGENDSEAPPPDETDESLTPLLDAFAQQWFIVEMLKGRIGELSGKLRFDISPYSTIRIESARERFIPGDDLGDPVYGTVLRVSHHIDASAKRAGTAFTVAHLRTEAENSDERTSISKPPLYKNSFSGCSLIDGF